MLGFIVDQDLQDLTRLKKFMETFVQLEGIASKDLQLLKNVLMENTIHSRALNQLMIAPIALQVLIAWVPILQHPLVFVRVDIIAH